MNIDELKARLEDVRGQMRSKDRNNPQQAQEYVELKRQEGELIEQITAAQKEQTIETKHVELQELVRGYNLNEIFDHPDANKIVHTMLMEEEKKHIEQLADKDARIAQLTAQGLETEDQLREANESLAETRRELTELEEVHDGLAEKQAELQRQLNEALEENQRLINEKDDIEELRKDLRWNRNENARLTLKLEETQNRLAAMLKEKESFTVSKPLAELVENARQHTQSRKQLKDVRRNPDGSITGINAEGSEETVPWFAAKSVEAVDTFPVPEIGEHIQTSVEEDSALVDTFQESTDPASAGVSETTVEDDTESVEQPRWHQWADETIRDLQRRVQGLENSKGINKAS